MQDYHSTSSPAMNAELFSRFFTQLLGKEDKYPIFLREWEYFHSLLKQTPQDMDSVTLYLASLPLNMEKEQHNISVISLPVPDSNYSSPVKPQRVPSRRMTSDRKSRFSLDYAATDAHSIVPSIGYLGDDLHKDTEPASAELSYHASFLNLNDLHCTKTHSSEIDALKPITECPVASESELPKEKYDLSFLVSKARIFKENYRYNSENLYNQLTSKVKTMGYLDLGERSPLRTFVVYNMKPTMIERDNYTSNNYVTRTNNVVTTMDRNNYAPRTNNVASNKATNSYKTNMYVALRDFTDKMNESSRVSSRLYTN